MLLSFSLATAISSNPSLLKSLATSATGLFPTLKFVSGKVVEVGMPVNETVLFLPPPVPRLPESSESVTGNRSPTKKVAGFPFCARSRTCRPLCTRLSASEKFAATPGRVKRNVVYPPPKSVNPGMVDSPFALKSCPRMVSAFDKSFEFCNVRISFGLIRNACVDAGGVIPSCCALLRSTSSSSISSISSPRARSTCRMSSLASASLSGESRMVMVRLCASRSMCAAPVISRSTRSSSVISSGATEDGSANVCSACKPYCRRFSSVSGATNISAASPRKLKLRVPACGLSRGIPEICVAVGAGSSSGIESISAMRSATTRLAGSMRIAVFSSSLACATLPSIARRSAWSTCSRMSLERSAAPRPTSAKSCGA